MTVNDFCQVALFCRLHYVYILLLSHQAKKWKWTVSFCNVSGVLFYNYCSLEMRNTINSPPQIKRLHGNVLLGDVSHCTIVCQTDIF